MNNAIRKRLTSGRVCLIRAGLCLSAAVILGCTTVVRGQLLINVGNHDLQPNTAGQVIDIFIQNTSGNDIDVGGVAVVAQVGNWDMPLPPTDVGPIISNADVITGTQFTGNNTLNQYPPNQDPGQFFNVNTTTASGTVSLPANSTTKLVSITLDTTGFSTPQTWVFALGDTIDPDGSKYFDQSGDDIFPTINDGTISVVPEPNVPLAVAGILGLFALWRRSRRPAVS